MITYQVESLFDILEEVDSLLELHYEEITLNKDRVKLKPIWKQYAALEAAGAFVVYTVRSEELLVGYAAFFLQRHLHYEDLFVASNDVIFLHPEYRRGTTGLRLIDFSEEKLKKLGVSKITFHVKLAHDWSPILHRRGFADEERVLGKLL